MADVPVLNPDSDLNARTLVTAEGSYTLSGFHTFSRSPNAPFGVASGSASVTNLDADKVDGKHATDLFASDGTGVMTGDLNLGTIGHVQFPATQNLSAGANVLDDYEEGIWTPVIGGSGGTSGQTYVAQTGRYTKIGRLVVCEYAVSLSAKGTITGDVQIQGLPFTATSGGNPAPSSMVMWISTTTAFINIIAQVSAASTIASLYGITAAVTNSGVPLATTDLANATQLRGTIVYMSN